MKPVEVRGQLVEALRLDLVGPDNGSGLEAEVLSQALSRWYLTGFIVPLEADPAQKSDDTAQDEFDFEGGDSDAGDDDTIPETPAARRAFFPSSIGLSLLVAETTQRLRVTIQWGDYRPEAPRTGEHAGEKPAPDAMPRSLLHWHRSPRRVEVNVDLPAAGRIKCQGPLSVTLMQESRLSVPDTFLPAHHRLIGSHRLTIGSRNARMKGPGWRSHAGGTPFVRWTFSPRDDRSHSRACGMRSDNGHLCSPEPRRIR